MNQQATGKSVLQFTLFTMGMVFSSACDSNGVQVQQIPKGIENIVSEGPIESVHRHHVEEQETPWSLPEGWTQLDKEVSMRYATILAKGEGFEPAELAISVFPGDVGGELANVNRWRGQMGQPELDGSQLDDHLTRFSKAGNQMYFARVEGSGNVLLVSGIYINNEDRTWFVRSESLSEPAADALEPYLIAFSESFLQEGLK